MTQRNISIHFVLPATAGHTATVQTKLTVHIDCLYCPDMELQENPSNGSRYTVENLKEPTNLPAEMLTIRQDG